MIDVLLDARMIRHSGIGTYIRGLWSGFRDHPFFIGRPMGLALSPSHLDEGNGQAKIIRFSSPIYSLREQFEYPHHLPQCRLWHAPHYNVPFLKTKTRLVVTIHDLIHWIYRKKFYSPLQALYAGNMIRSAIRNSERIIAVSEKTREDLLTYFSAPLKKIKVIYEGVSPGFFLPPDADEGRGILKKYGLPEKYFLYVGAIKPHKNVKCLIEVYRKLRRDRKINSDLVLVGKKDGRYPRGYEELKNLNSGGGIHYLAGIDSISVLHSLYHSARGLVHPSLYEGFGLTVLEAMATGTPVIASRTASLPEVAGDAAYYIDPYSEDSLAKALVDFEEDDRLREDLAKKGRERAKKFSWAKAAQETIDVYREVLSSS